MALLKKRGKRGKGEREHPYRENVETGKVM